MWRDPIVEEVRAIRDAYAKKFNHDIEAIYRNLKEQESKSDREFISLPPKRIKPIEKKDPTKEAEVGLSV
jgi:hypothetical protein